MFLKHLPEKNQSKTMAADALFPGIAKATMLLLTVHNGDAVIFLEN